MASKATEKETTTGLEFASDRKEAEFDLVKNLLEAASYKTSEEAVSEIEIRRNGKLLFVIHVHPISDADNRFARKKGAIMGDNPQGKKFPKIEKDFDNSLYKSWLLYLATTEEDKEKIWGNKQVMQNFDLKLPVESIDILLNFGEKNRAVDIVLEISGLNDEEDEGMDEETFLA